MQSFRTTELLTGHLRSSQQCVLNTCIGNALQTDPEDGITSRIRQVLDKRGAKAVSNWDQLWKTLFPLDQTAISPGINAPFARQSLSAIDEDTDTYQIMLSRWNTSRSKRSSGKGGRSWIDEFMKSHVLNFQV